MKYHSTNYLKYIICLLCPNNLYELVYVFGFICIYWSDKIWQDSDLY